MWNVLWIWALVYLAEGAYVVEINKMFKPCPQYQNKMSPFPFNMSNLQIYLSEDDKLIMNGDLIIARDINSPMGLSIYTYRQDHGEWLPTPYGKRVLNFCPLILSNTDIWYIVTKHMKQTHCPYKQGHVETFDMVQLDYVPGIEEALPELSGEWRVFIETTIGAVPHMMQVSCIMNELTILEH